MDVPLSTVAEEKDIVLETAAPGDLVSEAVKKMHAKNIGALPVVDGGRVVGMFTERDALFRVIDGKLDPDTTPVEAVMTADPNCVSGEMTVMDAMRLVSEKRYRHLPLVEADKLVGLVSATDLTRWVVKEQKAEITNLNREKRGLAGTNKALMVLVVIFVLAIAIGVITS